jgi:hypothetical protein
MLNQIDAFGALVASDYGLRVVRKEGEVFVLVEDDDSRPYGQEFRATFDGIPEGKEVHTVYLDGYTEGTLYFNDGFEGDEALELNADAAMFGGFHDRQ